MAYRNDFADDVIEELLAGLAEGKFLSEICADKRMPDRVTIYRWAKADDDLATLIVRAREAGYHRRAEKAVQDAKAAQDAGLGRLAFDAERWHLSKLSRAFADKVVHAGDPDDPVQVRVERVERIVVDPANPDS